MRREFQPLYEVLNQVLLGKPEVVELTMIAAFGGGHLLIEDLPGVGKTSLGRAIAQRLGGEFQRVQLTADLMPSDLTGVNVFHPEARRFEFIKGPLFCHVLLADELNRASPKVQSSLLEAMAEGQVSVERHTHPLPDPFWVIATQNPVSFEGTFPLPESQLDRFGLSTSIGYPPRDAERLAMKSAFRAHPTAEQAAHHKINPLHTPTPLFSPESWREERLASGSVHVSDELLEYMLSVARLTREHPALKVGVSTRGLLGWQRACQARAHLYGRDFVTPDDVRRLTTPALAHRISPVRTGLSTQARSVLLSEVIGELPLPR